MVETKLAVKTEEKGVARPSQPARFHPFESLHREVDRLFKDFEHGNWLRPFGHFGFDAEPFSRRELRWGNVPAMDVAEKDREYEVTAELPGMDENNIEVKLSNGMLTIKGEKKEEKEERKKDYYLSERRYGAFERSLSVPEGIDAEKIEAVFKNGVLTVRLPKTPEAQKKEKKIAVKAH